MHLLESPDREIGINGMSGFVHKATRLLWRQPWLPPRYQRSLYKMLCERGEVLDVPFRTDFFGLRYEGNLNNNIEFNLYYFGAFEKALLFFLRDTLARIKHGKRGGAASGFCDIGANIGQHSLFMSQIADRVDAFEPFPAVNARLEHHITLNRIGNIVLHKVGLSDASEQLPFFAPSGRNQGIGSFDESTTGKGNVYEDNYALIRGDDYFRRHRLPACDLIKIDVEGFEKKVIRGLRETLDTQRPILVCEVSYGKALSFSTRQELLEALPADYRLLTFDTRKPDGSKARRRGATARKTGAYRIVPFDKWQKTGQDDIIACPEEKTALIPLENPMREQTGR